MKILFQLMSIIFALFIFLTVQSTIYAQTSYILPYSSYMPGNKMYTIAKWWETIKRYWSFGNLSQFFYQLRTADKYLVEAETLLTRKQYRLGFAALEQSDSHFIAAALYLVEAFGEGKDIAKKETLYSKAAETHIVLLGDLTEKLPKIIHWEEENGFKNDYNADILLKIAMNRRRVGVSYVIDRGDATVYIAPEKP